MRSTEHIGRERLAQRVRLQQYRQAGECALLNRRSGEAAERGPDGCLLIGTNGHTLMRQATLHPLGRPGAVARLVDARERLEGDRAIGAQVIVLAAQPQHRRPHGAPHVEGEDARAGVAAELQRQRGEQDGLAHAGRADDQSVPHVADMGHQPEWRRTLGAGDDQRRPVEVRILLRPGPYRRHRHQVGEIQRRDDGLAHVGVGVARHRRQPCLHRVEGFRDGHETPALDGALHPA
ncbi:hypothetical protein FQZ97_737350 [compost metagenome]